MLDRGKLDMLNKVKRLMKSLRRQTSGNVLLIFAVGMPVFIGGAGLAVDTAQWYMWKREMQYAVDQAAMAGAWSRVGGTEGNEYQTRAQQELAANLQMVDFEGTPTIALANYSSGTLNSVKVSLSATRSLPFSSLVMGSGVTINVLAQARFTKAQAFTACLIATDPTTVGAITFEGHAYLVARCGVAALARPEGGCAIVNNGTGTFNVGYLVAAGCIDPELAGTFTDPNTGLPYTNTAFDNQAGLVDPFKDLTPPDNTTPQTYGCASGGGEEIAATYSITTAIVDKTYTAATEGGAYTLQSSVVYSTATEPGHITMEAPAGTRMGDSLTPPLSVSPVTVPGTPALVSGYTTPATTTTTCNSAGKNCTTTTTPGTTVAASWKRIDRVTTQTWTVTNVDSKTKAGGAAMQPGTYTDFTVSCATTMAPGVYVIDGSDGGGFKLGSTYAVSGPGVMIVLKNGANLDVNGGSNLSLSSMSFLQMRDAGISEAEAIKLKDMLIFEDRNSSGAGGSGDKLNGNAGAILEGTIYLPKSSVTFNGTFGIVSRCLVIAAKTITIGGTAEMSSFCPSDFADHTGGVSVGGGEVSVRLVA